MIPFTDLPPEPTPAKPEEPAEAKCRRCRRKLQDPVSLGFQIGPDCRDHLGIPKPQKPPRIGVRWTGPVEGQTDLLEQDQQGDEMTETTKQSPHDPRLLKLAAAALWAAVAEDWTRANKAAQMIGDEFGGDGVVTAMIGWADTVIAQTPGLVGDGRPVRLAFQQLETGHIDYDAERVPDGVRWAGRLLTARAADDEDAFAALIDSVPDDVTFSRNVGCVLQMAALNLRALQTATAGEGESQ